MPDLSFHSISHFFSSESLQILSILHILLCVFVVALVFVQQGKGSDVGASFGAGSSNTMFGAGGSFSFLFKLTAFVVFLFFASSLSLNYWFAKQEVSSAPSAQVKNNPQVPNVPGQVPG